MKSLHYRIGRMFLCRADYHSELIDSITDFAKMKKIKMAVLSVIGAVDDTTIAYYDHEKQEYQKIVLKKPLEISSAWGNVSMKDGRPFAHVHAVLSDERGRTIAGHLVSATVFAAEIHLLELIGKRLEREHDPTTGLSLWSLKT
ncbi:MAG: PPC domain-containing DNA-binding protein [Candidatus Hadarchaeum sp.]|uniref:PPC domain-containing DNA-binding protein n=1 Tax=Candidatus Hadarchaeum sp. TaxID=2883567 RepID=UPI003D0D788C